MRTRSKTVLSITLVMLLLFGWWIADIPIGYYQFKQMCEKEGGLRVLEPLEKDVGWEVKYESDAELPAQFDHVAFVRAAEYETGKLVDIKYLGGQQSFAKYDKKPADLTKIVRYSVRDEVYKVYGAIRLYRQDKTIFDLRANRKVARYSQFAFQWTNPERTLLGRSDSAVCPALNKQETGWETLAFRAFGG